MPVVEARPRILRGDGSRIVLHALRHKVRRGADRDAIDKVLGSAKLRAEFAKKIEAEFYASRKGGPVLDGLGELIKWVLDNPRKVMEWIALIFKMVVV